MYIVVQAHMTWTARWTDCVFTIAGRQQNRNVAKGACLQQGYVAHRHQQLLLLEVVQTHETAIRCMAHTDVARIAQHISVHTDMLKSTCRCHVGGAADLEAIRGGGSQDHGMGLHSPHVGRLQIAHQHTGPQLHVLLWYVLHQPAHHLQAPTQLVHPSLLPALALTEFNLEGVAPQVMTRSYTALTGC